VEDAAIREGFEAGKSWIEILDGLPGRTLFAVRTRTLRLGLKHCEAGVPWRADEDATLRAGVEAGESWETIAGKLPGRTADASENRAQRLKLERREKKVFVSWTEAEDEEIRAGVAAGERNAQIAERLPGRTLDAVESRRTKLLKGQRSVAERWTEAEDAALREGFESGKTWREIAEGLPNRTMLAAQSRGLRYLGLKREAADGSA
jgi:hypothetical protein